MNSQSQADCQSVTGGRSRRHFRRSMFVSAHSSNLNVRMVMNSVLNWVENMKLKMNSRGNVSRLQFWSMTLLLAAITAGCGGGNSTSPAAPGGPVSTDATDALHALGLARVMGHPGAPVGPVALSPLESPTSPDLKSDIGSALGGAVSPLSGVPLLSTYALTTSGGLTTSIGSALYVSNSVTFGGNVAMDGPVATCVSTPAAAASLGTAALVGEKSVDSCGLEVGLFNTINGPINIPGGLKITGSTIRYSPNNSIAFNARVRSIKTALNSAWIKAAQQTTATLIPGPGALGGLHLAPGIYKSGSTMTLGSGETLTLDAFGNANGVWLFQVGSSMTITGSTVACTTSPVACRPTQVVLRNGAQAKNVYWQVGKPRTASGAPLGGNVSFSAATGPVQNNTAFVGTILAGSSVTFAGGTAVRGRILAGADLLGTSNTQSSGAVTTTGGATGPVSVILP